MENIEVSHEGCMSVFSSVSSCVSVSVCLCVCLNVVCCVYDFHGQYFTCTFKTKMEKDECSKNIWCYAGKVTKITEINVWVALIIIGKNLGETMSTSSNFRTLQIMCHRGVASGIKYLRQGQMDGILPCIWLKMSVGVGGCCWCRRMQFNCTLFL